MSESNQINPNGGRSGFGTSMASSLPSTSGGQVELFTPGSYNPYLSGKINLAQDTVLNITGYWAYLE